MVLDADAVGCLTPAWRALWDKCGTGQGRGADPIAEQGGWSGSGSSVAEHGRAERASVELVERLTRGRGGRIV